MGHRQRTREGKRRETERQRKRQINTIINNNHDYVQQQQLHHADLRGGRNQPRQHGAPVELHPKRLRRRRRNLVILKPKKAMKKSYLIITAAALLAAASCQKGDNAPASGVKYNPVEVVLSAAIEGVDTKVSYAVEVDPDLLAGRRDVVAVVVHNHDCCLLWY